MAQQAGPSSSFTRRRTYDVFINFRRIDTHFGFVEFLYQYLNQRGIYTFIDDGELERGEEIVPTLFRAIQESRIVIVVFSIDYASSSWCLKELVQIMEYSKGEGRFVFPVFYEVDPSEVRHQKGHYGAAFNKLENRFRDNQEIILIWRKALHEASNLYGFISSHYRSPAELIESIVEEVLKGIEVDKGADRPAPSSYDVFLSFRGADTCNSFVEFLYRSLNQRGVYTFLFEKSAKKGVEITPAIFTALQKSRIAIVVFSEGYASSSFCLDELVQIMEFSVGEGLLVIPVFYEVDPSEVRHQLGPYEVGLNQLEYRFSDNIEKVRKWREALRKAADLSGFVSYQHRSSAELIERIVEQVSKRIKVDEGADGRRISKIFVSNKEIAKSADGRWIGKIFVSNKEIAKGSNGTIVLEGTYYHLEVAVKRLVKAHLHDDASEEIQHLIESNSHKNIVQWYAEGYDRDFVYLVMERCSCTLDDLIQTSLNISENPGSSEDQTLNNMQGLWKANGHPSHVLLELMRGMVDGLAHLHKLRIIHRDLKPQNVLITKEEDKLLAKLSDMGISKRLLGDKSSLGPNATRCGTLGWQAPEQLCPQGRQTEAMDLFSLGCVLFFCITRGQHPFGDHHERDSNIWNNNQKNLYLIEFIPEAQDLISHLLDPVPDQRPRASKVLLHPFLWSSKMSLSFLCDASDRLETEDRKVSDLLWALEGTAPMVLDGEWDKKLHPDVINPDLITNINTEHPSTQKKRKCHPKRRYNFNSVQELLRLIRNRRNHYGELDPRIQELLGSVPNGFYDYFAIRFPRLLFEVYRILLEHCKGEKYFQEYFEFENVY